MTKTNDSTKSTMMATVATMALVLSAGAQQVAQADELGGHRAGEIAGVFLGGLYDNDGNYLGPAAPQAAYVPEPTLMGALGAPHAGSIAGVFIGGLYDNDGSYISAAYSGRRMIEEPALASNPCMAPMGTIAGVFANQAWDNDGHALGPASEEVCWTVCGPTPIGPQCQQRCACMRVGSAG